MKRPSFVPAFWAKADIATKWLVASGWRLKSGRAYKSGKTDIPAPGSNAYTASGLYDLHDVACEEGVGAGEIVRRIVQWAQDNGVDNAAGAAGAAQDLPPAAL